MADGELVRQARAGQTAAYEELVRRWSGRTLALCHARIGRPDVAEDLAQETLLRGYRSLATLHDPDKFGPWLAGIATRVCLDWLKARERTTVPFSALGPDRQPDALPSGHLLPGDASDRAEEVDQLLAEVHALPAELREVLMLYYYEDVTYQDLSDLLGVSCATINARLTKARALLRERMAPFRR